MRTGALETEKRQELWKACSQIQMIYQDEILSIPTDVSMYFICIQTSIDKWIYIYIYIYVYTCIIWMNLIMSSIYNIMYVYICILWSHLNPRKPEVKRSCFLTTRAMRCSGVARLSEKHGATWATTTSHLSQKHKWNNCTNIYMQNYIGRWTGTNMWATAHYNRPSAGLVLAIMPAYQRVLSTAQRCESQTPPQVEPLAHYHAIAAHTYLEPFSHSKTVLLAATGLPARSCQSLPHSRWTLQGPTDLLWTLPSQHLNERQ